LVSAPTARPGGPRGGFSGILCGLHRLPNGRIKDSRIFYGICGKFSGIFCDNLFYANNHTDGHWIACGCCRFCVSRVHGILCTIGIWACRWAYLLRIFCAAGSCTTFCTRTSYTTTKRYI
jgi:hypothetical protein